MKTGKFVPGGYTLTVKRSFAGLGLFTMDPIKKGNCIIEYKGRVVSKEEEETSRSKYLFQINKHLTIDGKPKINKAGYANHSCRPNSEYETRKDHVYIMAKRNIKPGEEITVDYGKEYWLEHCQPCRCEKCRNEPAKKKTA